jgi:hypothetical protein
MPLEISHVLVDIDNFSTLLVYLVQETFNQFCEFREFFLNHRIILFVLASDVREEFFEMLGIIHDQLVNDCLMKIDARELI